MSQDSLARLFKTAVRLADKGELKLGAKASASDITAAEAELGRSLPAEYVRFMREVGAVGDVTPPDFHGWSSDLRQIWGPKDAILETRRVRAEYGQSGRHARYVNEALFFMRWQRTHQLYGLDADGRVRILTEHRPGTMLRVEAPSFAELVSARLGPLVEDLGEATEPDERTDVSLDLEELKGPIKVDDLRAVERLTLYGLNDGKRLAPLGKLPELRELIIYGGDCVLPDALLFAPKLQRIDLSHEMKDRYGAGLNGVLKWMRETNVPPRARGFYVRLLADDPALEKSAKTDALLEALDAPNEAIARTALRLLAAHLEAPRSLKGARVVVLGKPMTKASALATQLAAAGGALEKKLGPKTTHALLGVHPRAALKAARAAKVHLVHETHLVRRLDAKGVRHLAKKDGGETATRLRELLLSSDAANMALAVSMMEQGGVPDGVLEAMLLVLQNPKTPPLTRKAVLDLATQKLPTFPKVVKAVLSRTNLFQSGATKLADRLKELEEKSGGAISGRVLAMDLMGRDDDDYFEAGELSSSRALLFALETKDQDFALKALERARQGDGISFGGLEARIGPAVETAPLARMKGIKRVGFAWAYLKTVPDALLSLTDLRALSLDDNDLKSLPDGLARLTKLEELSLSSNRIAEFPEVITRLTALKVLEFGQSETKPKLRGLPESIGKLVNLEKLDLHGQALGELPEALLTLPKLKEIDLTGVTIDAARKREVVAALKARRVKVSA